MATQPVRVDLDLFDDASHVGAVMGRSSAGQIEHWTRLGRAVEQLNLPQTTIEALLRETASDEPMTDTQHDELLDALIEVAASTPAAVLLAKSTHDSLVTADDDGATTVADGEGCVPEERDEDVAAQIRSRVEPRADADVLAILLSEVAELREDVHAALSERTAVSA